MTLNEKQKAEIDFHTRWDNGAIEAHNLAGNSAAAKFLLEDRTQAREERIVYWEARLPPEAEKFMGKELAQDLAGVLSDLNDVTNDYVGYSYLDAAIIAWDEVEIDAILRRGFLWAERFAERRVRRHNPRDRDKYQRFHRLHNQALALITRPKPLTSLVDYVWHLLLLCLFWNLYRLTWRGERVVPDINFEMVRLMTRKYRWHFDDALLGLLRQVPATPNATTTTTSRHAADLLEMKPLLLHLQPAELTVQVSERMWAGLVWASQCSLGVLMRSDNQEQLRSEMVMELHNNAFLLGYDGLLSPPFLPWQTPLFYSGETQHQLLSVNQTLVAAVHDTCLERWLEMDHRAATELLLKKCESGNLTSDEESRLLASHVAHEAVSSSLSEPDEGLQPQQRKVLRQRLVPVLNRLERLFGCQIRNGKGSEVVVYRDGAKPFRFGKHGQNPEVSTAVLRRALRRLAIPTFDWVRMAQK